VGVAVGLPRDATRPLLPWRADGMDGQASLSWQDLLAQAKKRLTQVGVRYGSPSNDLVLHTKAAPPIADKRARSWSEWPRGASPRTVGFRLCEDLDGHSWDIRDSFTSARVRPSWCAQSLYACPMDALW
jgi:hypothetical protein